jgi:hypothetical protein
MNANADVSALRLSAKSYNIHHFAAYYPDECEWEKKSDYYIPGNDVLTLPGKTPAECKDACENDNTFDCMSFDYRRDLQICYLQLKSRADYALTSSYLYDYYGRNCRGN